MHLEPSRTRHTIFALALLFPAVSRADVLELKNGTILNGTYQGGTATTVRFTTNAGMQVIMTSDIVALTFTTPAGAATTAAPAPAPAAPPPASGPTVTIPAGTTLLVSMLDPVSSKEAAGSIFRTELQLDLEAGGVMVARAGDIVYGRVESSSQARRATGKSTLDIRLYQLKVGDQTVSISTDSFKEAGPGSVAKVAKGAAAGAMVGAIAGDTGEGAAIGAAAGVLRRGQTITITPGTLLEFDLTQPLSIRPTG